MLKMPLVFTGLLPLRGVVPSTPAAASALPVKVPRVSRYMALAIYFNDVVQRGEVADFADIARLGHVTRARVSQIMNLLHLAPDIQDQLLFLPCPKASEAPIVLRDLQPIARCWEWQKQRKIWARLLNRRQDAPR